MKEKLHKLWMLIDSIQSKHALRQTSWNNLELETVLKQAETLVNEIQKTKYNEEEINKVNKAIEKIHAEQDKDYYTMDSLKDAIHRLWQYGFPTDEVKARLDEYYAEKKTTELSEIYPKMEKLQVYDLKTHPTWIDWNNGKKKIDVSIRERELFYYFMIKQKFGEKMGDRFMTFLHDVYTIQIDAMNIADRMPFMIDLYEKKIIPFEQLDSFIKRSAILIRNTLTVDESTWKGYKEETRRLYTEYALFRFHKGKMRCDDINCRIERELDTQEKTNLRNGEGIKIWYCKEHKPKSREK